MTSSLFQPQSTCVKVTSLPQQINCHLFYLAVIALFYTKTFFIARQWGSKFDYDSHRPNRSRGETFSSQDGANKSFLFLAAAPLSLSSIVKQKLKWLVELGLMNDPFLYLLFLAETNLATCRNFLRKNDDYLRSIVLEDPGHYYFLLRKGSQNPLFHIVLFPGVWPSILHKKRKARKPFSKRGTISSLLADSTDTEFQIKWLYCQEMGLGLETVIDRNDICQCRASSVIQGDLELFASIQCIEHLLETVIFALRYYLFIKYSLGLGFT